MGSNYPQYAHADGAPHVQNIYHHNNSQTQVWGNDREMMTCDGGGGVYFGTAAAPKPGDGATTIRLSHPAAGPQPGGALCILAGPGAGECRRVVANGKAGGGGGVPAGTALSLVPCGSGTGRQSAPLFTPANGTLTYMPPAGAVDAGGGGGSSGGSGDSTAALLISVLCDPPGEPSSSATCGANAYAEPLTLNSADSWTRQYHTQSFVFHPDNGTLTLNKQGASRRCVTAVASGSGGAGGVEGSAALVLDECEAGGGPRQRWTLPAAGAAGRIVLEEGGDSAPMCMGAAAVSPDKPDLATWVVDHPFARPPDSATNLTIVPYIGHIAFNGNHYSDGGEVQFYAQVCL
jgi:hypothetical protein